MDKKLRELVFHRAQGYCELCGDWLPESWAIHHRKLRSQGGRDEASNLVALHHECHNLGTQSVHLNPKKATEMGFIVKSWDTPEEIAICRPDGTRVILMNNGDVSLEIKENTAWQENQQSPSSDEWQWNQQSTLPRQGEQ